MTAGRAATSTIQALDAPTRALVQLAATIAVGSEAEVREALSAASGGVPPGWIEELILQSYLFAGFPRTLNAAREWRRISGHHAPEHDEGEEFERATEWRARGEATCATVYGRFYERLRHNIRLLHPALDSWMVVEGYGKVLGRPGLDLKRRELCILAVCAAANQDRQLHSHLHGALHAGATVGEVSATIAALEEMLGPERSTAVRRLWGKVRGHGR